MAWTGFSGRRNPAGPPGPDGDDQFGSQQEARVHSVIVAMPLSYYPLGAQIMTLVLPLGFFIVVMTALYFVFTTLHTIPGRRPIAGARPVAPAGAGRAASLAAATGLPTATAGGGPEPLAGRGTPPPVGARTEEAVQQ